MATHVRPARTDDFEGIVRMQRASFRAGHEQSLSTAALAELTGERLRSDWERVMSDPRPRSCLIVAEMEGGILGVASAGPAREDGTDPARDLVGDPSLAELYALFVEPAAWERGHGAALHDAALAHLSTAGFDEVILWVLEGNDVARRFYTAHGWIEDGARGDFMGAPKLRLRRAVVVPAG